MSTTAVVCTFHICKAAQFNGREFAMSCFKLTATSQRLSQFERTAHATTKGLNAHSLCLTTSQCNRSNAVIKDILKNSLLLRGLSGDQNCVRSYLAYQMSLQKIRKTLWCGFLKTQTLVQLKMFDKKSCATCHVLHFPLKRSSIAVVPCAPCVMKL